MNPDVTAARHRAVDVPRLRDELVRSWRGPLLPELLVHHEGPMQLPIHHSDPARNRYYRWTIPEWIDWLVAQLDQADLYYVTQDMTELVMQAAAAAPRYEVYEDRLPSRAGLVVYGKPFCHVPADRLPAGQRCELQAALWAPVPDTGNGPGVMLVTMQDSDVLHHTQNVEKLVDRRTLAALAGTHGEISHRAATRQVDEILTDMRALAGPLAYHEEYPLPFGNKPWDTEPGTPVRNRAIAAVMTTWTLMGQRITSVEREDLPRSVRRPYSREGRPEPVVRTVDLRRAVKGRDADRQEREPGRETSRRYRHRWPVKEYGYWRDTWYPSRQRHEQQWVLVPGYMKGPAGAPIIGGERVNVLRR